jgi:pyruvate/2-oxoglutarate/acetoin dehydrogenase E1 component/pyruvate/2-oxoglutarate dehydrogenase complex dihydrolipoamide acyltransferase (E2) component
MQPNERVVQNLNRALRTLLERDDQLYVLGEDIADPYGGAFGVTRGLSNAFPDRVITTPISESAMIGVANGLALCGNKVIAEIMFSDFIGLAFDQLLNFTSKAVAMYGQILPMPVIVRCPVGGNRGYGPTHSQSPQKYFMGIPNLSLYELSPFHDAKYMLAEIFATQRPAILFEPKALYPSRVYRGGKIDDIFSFEFLSGTEWVHIFPSGGHSQGVALFAAGGMVSRSIEAGRILAEQDGIGVHILVPARLYPLSISPIMDLLADMTAVCVAEESSAGGTWGNEVARHVHDLMWDKLSRPALTISSRDCIIPAAPHLEKKVLVDSDRICSAVRTLTQSSSAARHISHNSASASRDARKLDRSSDADDAYVNVTVPKFNSNDTEYVLLDWLAHDGERVRAGDVIAEIETSKAVQELAAPASGVIVHEHAAGAECRPSDTIARLMLEEGVATLSPVIDRDGAKGLAERDSRAGQTRKLSRNQLLVSEAVSASHREIPDAFLVVQAGIDPVLKLQQAASGIPGQTIGMMEALVIAVASLEGEYPTCFGGLLDGQTARVPDGAHIGVTMDAGNGLFIPVVRSAERLGAEEICDLLASFRVQAVRGIFTEEDLADPNIVISWNYEINVSMVKAVIPPGLACVISVGGPRQEVFLSESGQPLEKTVVNLGLTHDHRVVNGREAAAFLQGIAAILDDERRLGKLLAQLAAMTVADNPAR